MASRRTRVVNGPLIKPREPGRITDLGRMLALCALLAAPAFLYAGLQAQLLDKGRNVVALKERFDELEDERQRLDAELATSRDYRRIEELARAMGLEPIDPEQVIYLGARPFVSEPAPPLIADTTGDADGRR